MTTVWEIGTDPEELHALLVSCDAYQAEQSGTLAPDRRIATTDALVRDRAVHVLRSGGQAIAMFTLTMSSRSGVAEADYPPARQPAYLSRLAVTSELLAKGTLTGARCVKKAIEMAIGTGADVLRAEANPDLVSTRDMLAHLGFEQHGSIHTDETGRRYVRLQKILRPDERGQASLGVSHDSRSR